MICWTSAALSWRLGQHTAGDEQNPIRYCFFRSGRSDQSGHHLNMAEICNFLEPTPVPTCENSSRDGRDTQKIRSYPSAGQPLKGFWISSFFKKVALLSPAVISKD